MQLRDQNSFRYRDQKRTGIRQEVSGEQGLMEEAKIEAQLVGIGIFNSEGDSEIPSIRGSTNPRTHNASESTGGMDLGKHHALHDYRGIGLK